MRGFDWAYSLVAFIHTICYFEKIDVQNFSIAGLSQYLMLNVVLCNGVDPWNWFQSVVYKKQKFASTFDHIQWNILLIHKSLQLILRATASQVDKIVINDICFFY